ncbi:MAG: CHAT domain-containing protein [Gammaproteobacteria bacterium]|nr:CHAT domain-containing protein [Gammaproteobacteria bacterium]
MTFHTLFDRYGDIKDIKQRMIYAASHPVLINSKEILAMKDEIDSGGDDAAGTRMKKLAELDQIRVYFAEDARRFPVGSGPVEHEAQQVLEKKESIKTAVENLVQPENAEHLTTLYAHLLVYHAETRITQGDLQLPVLWARLLAESSLRICPEGEWSELLEIAGIGWIQVAGVAMGAEPDGEVLQSARSTGEELLKRLGGKGQQNSRANVLHALGALYSDPVTGSSGAGLNDMQQRMWRRAVQAKRGDLADAYMQKYPLPEPKEMLEQALRYFEQALPGRFEQALPGRVGEGRGITLKAIAQTLLSLSHVNGTAVDVERIKTLCHEAMTLLSPDNYHYQAILAMLASLGQQDQPGTNPAQAVDDALLDSPDKVLLRISQIFNQDPQKALQLLDNSEELFNRSGTEVQRQKRLRQQILLIPKVYGGVQLQTFPASFEQVTQELQSIAERDNWNEEQLASACLDLAVQAQKLESEELGIQLLQISESLPLITAHPAPVAFLYLELASNAAVNALNAENPVEAVRLYAYALGPALRLGLPARAFELLERIADLAGRNDDRMAEQIIYSMTPAAFEIEQTLGETGLQAYREIFDRAIWGMGERMNSFILGMLMQLGKGLRFDMMLHANSGFDWRQDQKAIELNDLIVQQQKHAGKEGEEQLIKDLLLLSGVSAQSALDGESGDQLLHNLQYAFDRHVNFSAIKSIREPDIMNPEVIPYFLDKRTVLLDYYFARNGEDKGAVIITAYTKQAIKAFRNLLSETRDYVVDEGHRQFILSAMAMRTFRLREAIKKTPGNAAMTDEARTCLKEDFELLLGSPVWDYLGELSAQGLDHLCIRPHGALRYYPLQLLGKDGIDLADNWIVTYLPSLECLMPKTVTRRDAPGQALGLGYADDSYAPLPELPNAEAEVNAIARVFSTEPVFDAAVTEAVVLQTLAKARYVHLCAHGAHNPYAPVFHNLRVTPDADNDGRVCAYEIMGMDLKGLEVLSLGSCDSALGRFDAGDNLSGLPAAFLLSGVQTILAGLWELVDDAAVHFFVSFYKALAKGSSKLDAFRHAQLTVRALYPEARDWAAFIYIGDWERETAKLPANINTYFKQPGRR